MRSRVHLVGSILGCSGLICALAAGNSGSGLGPSTALSWQESGRLSVGRSQPGQSDAIYLGVSSNHDAWLIVLARGKTTGVLDTPDGGVAVCHVTWRGDDPTSFRSSTGTRANIAFTGTQRQGAIEGTARFLDGQGHVVTTPLVLHRLAATSRALTPRINQTGVYAARSTASGLHTKLILLQDRDSTIAVFTDGHSQTHWLAASRILTLRDSVRFG